MKEILSNFYEDILNALKLYFQYLLPNTKFMKT